MLVRRKRARAGEAVEDFLARDDTKKLKIVLVASGLKRTELDAQVKDYADRRKARVNKAMNARTGMPGRDGRPAGQLPLMVDEDHPLADPAMDEAIFNAFTRRDFSNGFRLIEHAGRHVNSTRRTDGTSLLMAACYCADREAILRLLAAGADPDQQDVNGNSPKEFIIMQQLNPVLQSTLLQALKDHEYVYDLFEMDENVMFSDGSFNRFGKAAEGMLVYDDSTGQFIEFVHDEDDDFGRAQEGEESDSNSSGYYERHMDDESDFDEEDEDGDTCALDRQYWKPFNQRHAHEEEDDQYMDDGYMGDN